MFTGIVEEIGTIRALNINGSSGTISVKASKVLEGIIIGDSIAVNGICLTVVSMDAGGFTADIMAETVRRSSFGAARAGDRVNLERAMAANGRFNGHIVAGHVDATGIIRSMEREENAIWITIEAPDEVLRYIIEKGSITIDGVSLTVAYVDENIFKVSIIPHTADQTVLMDRSPGDKVNLENDMIGKYVEKLMGLGPKNKTKEIKSNISLAFLEENGF